MEVEKLYYKIADTLQVSTMQEALDGSCQYVAVLRPRQWNDLSEHFQMGIDLDMELENQHTTRAEVNFDSLTGGFCIPDRGNLSDPAKEFAFVLDERGIVFIDNGNTVQQMVRKIRRSKKWRMPSLERFLYDFLSSIIAGDLELLESYEDELKRMEDDILEGRTDRVISRITEIRSDVLTLRSHYEQLIDLGEELIDNENNFFQQENLRYFSMFNSRIERLRDIVTMIREYTVQVRDLYQSQLSVAQNHTMTILTVVTVVFTPLTLITGWFGMNFKYMPELDNPWSYPIVFIVSLLIAIGSLIFFKRKNWL